MQDERTQKLEHEAIPKLLLHYATPAVVGTLVAALYNLVDRIFIGQSAGAYAMAGLALTFPVLIFLQAFGMLVGSGASARVSILLGEKDYIGANRILGNAIILTLLLSITSAALSLYFLEDLLRLFGGSERSIPFAKDYLQITIPGNIFTALAMTYNSVMRASGYPRKAMYTMLIGAILNTILDYIFIRIFGWGIAGASWATVISMFVSAVFVMSHFFDKKSLVHFQREHLQLSRQSMMAITSIGISPFTVQLLGSISNALINRGFTGSAHTTEEADMAIGALGVINSYVMICFFVMIGIAQATQPIVGYNHGAGKQDRVARTIVIAAGFCGALGLIFTILGQVFKTPIVALFTQDAGLQAAAVNAMGLCTYALLFMGTQIIATQFFQSIGHSRKAFFLSILRQALILIPLLIIMPHFMGIDGVWVSLPIADATAGICGIAFVTYYFKQIGLFNKTIA